MELNIMKVYLESKLQVETLIGHSVGELEIFNGYWLNLDGHIFIKDTPSASPTICDAAFEIVKEAYRSNEIVVFMCDDYVSESVKTVVVKPEMEVKNEQ